MSLNIRIAVVLQLYCHIIFTSHLLLTHINIPLLVVDELFVKCHVSPTRSHHPLPRAVAMKGRMEPPKKWSFMPANDVQVGIELNLYICCCQAWVYWNWNDFFLSYREAVHRRGERRPQTNAQRWEDHWEEVIPSATLQLTY